VTDIELAIERPAAGGRMLARLDGRVVLVAGAIPGERVRARMEKTRGGVLLATTVAVIEPSPDRRDPGADPACGGRDFAHIELERQRTLKAEIVVDAFRRLARQTLPLPVVHASPEQGYRMRARLHVRAGRIGFFREGTHTLCDAACSGQLRDDTMAIVGDVAAALARAGAAVDGALELAENREATERAALLDLSPESRVRLDLDHLLQREGLTGFGIARGGRPLAERGSPFVADVLALSHGNHQVDVRLRRHVAGFFQGNRFLLQTLVERVLAHVPAGPLTDLYSGVGLFGVAHAALGRGDVLAVEGDAIAAADLTANAEPVAERLEIETTSVEDALRRRRTTEGRTVVLDPPRTGLSVEASATLVAARPPRIVYVSCDVATLARDVARLAAAGYTTENVEAFDLFPGTALVETLTVLSAA
jgi:tRNA/tmRNA/rRNA uracil-C5-methylase (TrmA/RlmC/RlmD family)